MVTEDLIDDNFEKNEKKPLEKVFTIDENFEKIEKKSSEKVFTIDSDDFSEDNNLVENELFYVF